MKKVLILCIVMTLVLCGCSKVSYSSEFAGIPVYPGTELISSNENDGLVTVMYGDMSFNGDAEKVKEYFEKNIDKDIWTVEASDKELTGHNVDKIYGYNLESKDMKAALTIAYADSDKAGKHITISIIGNKQK
jgi:hypothetical protein